MLIMKCEQEMSNGEYLLKKLEKSYLNCHENCNVTIEVDSSPVLRAHGIVLAAASSFFEQALTAVYPPRATIVLDLQSEVLGITPEILAELVNYCYSGVIKFSEDNVKASETMNFTFLTDFLQKVKKTDGSTSNPKHFSEMLGSMKSLREKGVLTDCVFYRNKVGVLPAHRHVVGAFSAVLARMFAALSQKALVTVGLDAPNFAVLRNQIKVAVDYMYTGVVGNGERLRTLDTIARKLDIKVLLAITEKKLAENEEKMNVEDKCLQFDDELAEKQYKKIYGEYVNTTGITSKFLTTHTEKPDCSPSTSFVRRTGDEMRQEELFRCANCDHTTNNKDSLNKHLKVMHTDDVPFTCEICNMGFKVRSNYLRHQRSHQGARPYECKKCKISYAEKKTMDKHVLMTHLGMKPISCTHPGCKSKFLRVDRLQAHTKRFHKIES